MVVASVVLVQSGLSDMVSGKKANGGQSAQQASERIFRTMPSSVREHTLKSHEMIYL